MSFVRLKDLAVGQRATMRKVLGESEVQKFAEVVGDYNPIHLDARYAAKTKFGRKIAHGMLSSSLLSATVATHLPGPGVVYLKQELNFRAPVFVGDVAEARVEITSIRRNVVTFSTSVFCCSPEQVDDETAWIEAVDGQAVTFVPSDADRVDPSAL